MKYSMNMRFQYFETEGYNSRIYTYENDVLYNYSIPSFFDKGYRIYINISHDFGKKLTIWSKLSSTIYPEKSGMGSGLDAIEGKGKTDLHFEIQYKF